MTLLGDGSRERPPLHEYPSATVGTRHFSHHGVHSMRYNGVCALTGSLVLMSSGRFVMFMDVRSCTIRSMPGPVNGGVGAVAVHPTREFFVVCEKALRNPLIRAYSWPSCTEVGQFVDGATKGFSACCFNADGSMMATVGMYPDFSLAIWDWNTRGMILRNKSHGADVYTVMFSPFDSGLLVTGGAGHIKFWSMAKTFTGLKLQGMLGKFGRLEISNVPAFVVLSDGKVLSGSEGGLILLWEGDLVRCAFAREILMGERESGAAALAAQTHDYIPCHGGTINVVLLLGDGRVLLTAGDDGYMRYWRVSELEAAEGEGMPPFHAPECLCEVLVDSHAHIRAATHCSDANEWVVLDSTGALWRVPFLAPDEILAGTAQRSVGGSAVAVLHFNGGGITSSAVSLRDHTVVTGGEDGSIRLIDYVSPRELYILRFPFPNTVVALRFFRTDSTGTKFIACYENGTILLLQRGESAFTVLDQWRPHKGSLKAFAVDAAERRLCSISTASTAFFFDIAADLSSLRPVGFCLLPLPDAACVAWDDTTSCCLVGHECGKVLAIRPPAIETVDQSISFEFPCSFALVGIRQRKRVEKNVGNAATGEREEEQQSDEEEEDVGPWPVRFICPLPDGTFAIGAGSAELLYMYRAHIRYEARTELPPLPATGIEPPDYVEEPIVNLCYRDCIPQSASVSATGKFLVVLCEGAQLFLRPLDTSAKLLQLPCVLADAAHDRVDGRISAACTSFDDTMLISTGSDGLVVAQLLDGCNAPPRTDVPAAMARSTVRQREAELLQPIEMSIIDQKEADDRRRAEEAKQRELDAFLSKLSVLHAKYAELLRENSAAPKAFRLSKEELSIHPHIAEELQAEKQRRVQDARRSTALQLAREDLRTRKMRRRFVDNLIYDRFLVQSFSREFVVASFRTPNPDEAIQRFEAEIDELLAFDENNGDTQFDGVNGDAEDYSKGNAEDEDHALFSTAAGITQWLASEAERHQRGKQTLQSTEMLTSTMRQYFDKMDERREERCRRKKGYELLLSQKPDPAREAARLEAELRTETARRGECVLRADPSHRSTPSAVAKLRQLIKLERMTVDMRSGFTRRLLAMRDEKVQLCQSLNVLLRRIGAINEKLKDDSVPSTELRLSAMEMPERRFVIDRDGLDNFSTQRQLEKAREEQEKKAQRGFGADLAVSDAVNGDGSSTNRAAVTPAEAGGDGSKGNPPRVKGPGRLSGTRRSKETRTMSLSKGSYGHKTSVVAAAAAVRGRMDHELRLRLENVKLTEAEEEEQSMERELLVAERRCLYFQLRSVLDDFDSRLWALYEERTRVDADLCLVHARSLLLFQEYKMLLVFRQKDHELRRQYEQVRATRDERRKEMEVLQVGVREQVKEIEKLQDAEKAFRHEVECFVDANFSMECVPYIMKVFLRQIKRRKHLGDVSADDDDITSDDEEEGVQDDEEWEEVCPPHCAPERWDELLEKRETRLDYADAIEEGRRKQGLMRRRIEEHAALAEQHDNNVSMCLKAIEDFQNEKRMQLNMLEVLVSLRCSQVRCLEEEKCPEVFLRDDLVLASDRVVSGLRSRIEALAEEKQERRLCLKSMASELQQLQRERSSKEALHAQWEERMYEAMQLKFGQVVNLELLESSCSCREVEELRERLRMEELKWEKEVRKRENKIAALHKQQQSGLVHNTHLLHDLADRESDRQGVERSLSQATQKVVNRIYDRASIATVEDRQNLKLLVVAQQEEIEALQAEVRLLHSKGGHIYVPSSMSAK